jgi:hypothetical protein
MGRVKLLRANQKGSGMAILTCWLALFPQLKTPTGRNAERIDAATENGDINLPELFRRQVDYSESYNIVIYRLFS